jgi:hypothetical protein
MDLPVDHMDTALKSIVKISLSTTACKNLGLYDKPVMTYDT